MIFPINDPKFLGNYLTSKTYPTLMPSSISVGATFSCKSTTNLANCFTLMIYFASSLPELIIFVHLATCNGCSAFQKNIFLYLENFIIDC